MYRLLHFLKTERKQWLLRRLWGPSQNREAQDKSVLQPVKAAATILPTSDAHMTTH